MNRLFKISGIIGWIFLIYHFGSYIPKYLVEIGKTILCVFGIISLMYVALRIKDKQPLSKILNLLTGKDLIDSMNIFVEKLPNPGPTEVSNLASQIIIRFTRIGLLTLLIASIPTILLYKQNQLLEQQNNRLTQQTYLQEAERRSSLVFLFSNIMNSIDQELKDDYDNNGKRDLSPQLIGRIISISSRLKPYRFLENGNLIETEISPERGQLLISLLASDLDPNVRDKLFFRSDFSYADLKGANLSRANMSYLNLNNSNLEDADLSFSVMNGGNCQNCNFRNANLRGIDVTENNFTGSEFSGSNLSKLNAYNTWFTNCNLSKANLEKTKFTFSFLESINLDDAEVSLNLLDQFKNNVGEDSIVGRTWVLNNYRIDSTYNSESKRSKSNELIYILKKK